MTILQMPSLPLDASGYPVRHKGAMDKAAVTLRELMNEVLEHGHWLHQTDAEWLITNVMEVYWHHLRREQR